MKINAKRIVLLCLVLVAAFFSQWAVAKGIQFNRSGYYDALASKNVEMVDKQLELLKLASIDNKEAFEGALLMKKAGMVAKVKEKLQLFKQGRTKLEAGIKKNADNIELKFLRLIIQENAPKILNYKGELESDALAIQKSYKSFPAALQEVIADYSKNSKHLHLKDL